MTFDPFFVFNVTFFLSSLGLVVGGAFSTAGVLVFLKSKAECYSAPLNPLSSSFTHISGNSMFFFNILSVRLVRLVDGLDGHTTHNTQHTTHNTQHTTHNTQHTTHNTDSFIIRTNRKPNHNLTQRTFSDKKTFFLTKKNFFIELKTLKSSEENHRRNHNHLCTISRLCSLMCCNVFEWYEM